MALAIAISGWEFAKGLWPALVATLAGFEDPLNVGKAVGVIDQQTEWTLGPDAMQAILWIVALGWMFYWFHRQRVRFALSELGPFNMSFSELARQVAFESRWGRDYDPSRWAHWRADLRREICGKLTTGEISARGVVAGPLGEASGPTLIEADFWDWAVFKTEYLLWVAIDGEPWTSAYTDEFEPRHREEVMFQREAVNRAWPRPLFPWPWRKKSPFRKWIKEWEAEQAETANHGPRFQKAFDARAAKVAATKPM